MLALAFALAITVLPEARQPQIAADGGKVYLTYGLADSIYFAASRNGGQAFDPPVRVAQGKIPIGRHRGPRISIAGKALVISAVLGQQGGGRDGDVLAWRSTDGGKSWSRGVRINDVEASAREGLHAMSSSGNTVFAAWLDLRANGTRLYGAVSKDGGTTWSKNTLVYESPDGTICQCCHPTVMVAPHGDILAMWRNALAGSRDMYVARSNDGGKTFPRAERLGSGTWKLEACPMDGGGLALDNDGKLWSAWRREDRVIVFSPKGEERVLGPGKDPSIAAGAKQVAVAWTDHGVKYVLGNGDVKVLDEAGSFVSLTGGAHIYAAWESGAGIKVARIDE